MMSTHRDGVNPLRPYYIPPTIGERTDPVSPPTSQPSFPSTASASQSSRYASKARDVLTDLDYKFGDDGPSALQSAKELLDELVWKYTSVLMAQPFEVAKVILQVRDQDENAGLVESTEPEIKKKTSSYGGSMYDVRPSLHDARHSQAVILVAD